MQELARRANGVMRLLFLLGVGTTMVMYAPRERDVISQAEDVLRGLRDARGTRPLQLAKDGNIATDLLNALDKDNVRHYAPEMVLQQLSNLHGHLWENKAHLANEEQKTMDAMYALKLLHLQSGLPNEATVALLAKQTESVQVQVPYIGQLANLKAIVFGYLGVAVCLYFYLIALAKTMRMLPAVTGLAFDWAFAYPGRWMAMVGIASLAIGTLPAVGVCLVRTEPVARACGPTAKGVSIVVVVLAAIAVILSYRTRRVHQTGETG